MASPAELVESLIIAIVMILIGLVLLFSLSMPWDSMKPIFIAAGFENVPAAWDTFDDRDYNIEIMRMIPYVLFILAPVQFVLIATKRQEYDQTVYER